MAITWAPSADKHGIDRADVLHAIMNAYYIAQEFEDARPPATIRPTLYIGPPRKLGGELLEIMAEVTPPRGLHIFHVMVARPKHLALLEEDK